MMWYGDHMGGYAWGWGMMFFMGLFWLAVLAVVVGLLWSVARGRRNGSGSGVGKTPLQILEERYARGEIDKSEFEQKKHDLQH